MMVEIGYDAGDRGEPEYPEEHVHEWRFGYRSDGNYNLPGASTPGFYCTHKKCGYDSGTWLSLVEAEARLNAPERLLTAAKKLRARTYQSPTPYSAMDWLGVRRDAFMELLDAITYADALAR